jgi:hypothetical protein
LQDKSEDTQRAQSPQPSTEQNNGVSDEIFIDADENVNAEPQSTGDVNSTNGADNLATQNNSQRATLGARLVKGSEFLFL